MYTMFTCFLISSKKYFWKILNWGKISGVLVGYLVYSNEILRDILTDNYYVGLLLRTKCHLLFVSGSI